MFSAPIQHSEIIRKNLNPRLLKEVGDLEVTSECISVRIDAESDGGKVAPITLKLIELAI
ncbi:hypothetical protein [Nostoc sp. GT001]|uniref:hypothetical protein n=1 Tax=Nostoc sp. GT001 TaxID=3056647 RepID=UPI0025AB3B5A|nr:hypothetical protein [Nostoc sp. GT001]MDM9580974.1 hypothetical protein [Nostoc sp. GT001]